MVSFIALIISIYHIFHCFHQPSQTNYVFLYKLKNIIVSELFCRYINHLSSFFPEIEEI